jgi:hypothetical protein
MDTTPICITNLWDKNYKVHIGQGMLYQLFFTLRYTPTWQTMADNNKRQMSQSGGGRTNGQTNEHTDGQLVSKVLICCYQVNFPLHIVASCKEKVPPDFSNRLPVD